MGTGDDDSRVGNTAKYRNGNWYIPVYSKSTGKIISYIDIPDDKDIHFARNGLYNSF